MCEFPNLISPAGRVNRAIVPVCILIVLEADYCSLPKIIARKMHPGAWSTRFDYHGAREEAVCDGPCKLPSRPERKLQFILGKHLPQELKGKKLSCCTPKQARRLIQYGKWMCHSCRQTVPYEEQIAPREPPLQLPELKNPWHSGVTYHNLKNKAKCHVCAEHRRSLTPGAVKSYIALQFLHDVSSPYYNGPALSQMDTSGLIDAEKHGKWMCIFHGRLQMAKEKKVPVNEKSKMVEEFFRKAGKCAVCWRPVDDANILGFDCDHRNANQKTAGIGRMMKDPNFTAKELREELDLCDLLCATCHNIKTLLFKDGQAKLQKKRKIDEKERHAASMNALYDSLDTAKQNWNVNKVHHWTLVELANDEPPTKKQKTESGNGALKF